MCCERVTGYATMEFMRIIMCLIDPHFSANVSTYMSLSMSVGTYLHFCANFSTYISLLSPVMLCTFPSPASLDFHFGRTQIAARNIHSQFDMTLAYTSGRMVYSWKRYSVSPFKYESVYALSQSESRPTNSKDRRILCHVLVGCCMVFRGSGSRCGYCRFSRIVDTCRRPLRDADDVALRAA